MSILRVEAGQSGLCFYDERAGRISTVTGVDLGLSCSSSE
jgi:hypothetical protein